MVERANGQGNGDPFVHVRRLARSRLPNQRMAAALLTAVEQTIAERGLEPTPTAYFASLMTLLAEMDADACVESGSGATDTDPNSPELGSCEAVTYLLALIMPSVPAAVLREKFSDAAAVFGALLHALGQVHAPIARHLVECVTVLVGVQEVGGWSGSALNGLVQSVLSMTVDPRPKLRKLAHFSLLKILAHPPAPMVYHPAGIVVARFLIHTLRECGASDEAVTLHLLPFIKDVWPFVKSPQHLHQLAMLLVTSRQATSGSTHVLAAVFETLGALFVLNTSEAEVVSYARFPMDKFPALYAALLEMRPNVNDTHLLPLWLATVVDGLCMHTEQDADAAATHTFGKAFDAIFGLLALTPNTKSVAKTVHVCIRQALEAVVEMAVTDGMIKEALQGGERVHVTPAFKSMVDKVTRGLSLAYQSGWGVVLETIRALLERLFKFDCASNAANDNSAETAALSLMTATLTSLSDDKVYAQNQYFAHHDQLKRVLGTAIRTLGPRRFLVIFPLNMAAAEDQPADDTSATTGPARTWLLPLLKEHVANTELQFFLDYFIPLSQRVAEHGQRLVLAEKAVEGKTCAVVWRQLWDLLPCFCVAPTDLKETFESICKIIVPMLASNDDRVPSICEALRAFITRNRMIAADPMAVDKHNLPFRGVSQQQARDNLTFLAAYAQHILPPLFGKFVELHGAVAEVTKAEVATMNVSPAQMRDAVLETVRTWIGVADQAVINRFFEATMTKYLATAEGDDAPAADDKVAIAAATSQKHALFDLTLAILASKRLEVPAVQVLVRILYMGMSNVEGDAAVQKKSYRAWWLLYDYATTAGTVPSSEEGAEVVEDDGIVTRAKAIDGALWSNPTFLHELLTKLMDPTVTVAVASKRDRLALMAAIVTCFQWPVEADSSVAAQWSQLLSFIPALISESILMTKEVSEKTRAAAYELLLAMGRKMIEMERESEGAAVIPMGAGDDAEADEDANSDTDEEKDKSGVEAPANLGEYMKMVMAGLAGKTPHMISATIHSLARMLFEFRQLEEGALDDELVRTVIQVVLIYAQESKSREIIKSAISFIKVVTVVCADLIEPTVGDDDDAIAMEQDGGDNGDDDEEAEDTGPFNYVKNIVRALLKWSSEHKSHFKVACRFVIEKMIRKFGFEALERYFPAEHHKLLTNIRKIRERKARRAAEGKLAAKDANQGPTSFADLMKEQGSDGEEEEEELMRGHGKGGDTVMHSDDDDEDIPEMLRELVGSKSQRRGRMSLAIREGADEEMADDSDGPVDFLDRKVISKLYTAKGAKGRGARGAAAKISSTMPMDKDGRFIVRDSEDEDASGDVPLTAEETAAAAAQGHYMASIKSKDAFRYSGDGKKIKFSNKRSRDGEDDGEDTAMALDTAAASTTARPTANAVSRTQRNTKKRCTAEQELAKANVRTTGKEYRSKRARGDVKREDMPDPYAYIPLNAKIVASGKGRRKNVHINRKLFDL